VLHAFQCCLVEKLLDLDPHGCFVQVSKYNRRWFELTADTLAYAGDPQELRESHIEVFAIHEMQYIKRVDDVKLEVSALLVSKPECNPGYGQMTPLSACVEEATGHTADNNQRSLLHCISARNCGSVVYAKLHFRSPIPLDHLQMKFPERLLVVKAASPGEADKWHGALEKAMKEKQQGPGTPHQRAVENIKKVTEWCLVIACIDRLLGQQASPK
jgi:hypothetical protein